MRLIILEDADVVAEWAARFVLQRVTQFAPGPGRHFVLGLPTGGTPLGMYRKLIQFYKEGKISFKHVTTFNMDEYVGWYHTISIPTTVGIGTLSTYMYCALLFHKCKSYNLFRYFC
jgi:hypothetical protein